MRKTSDGIIYDVLGEIDPEWDDYSKTVATGHLHNYGCIFIDDEEMPIDNEYDLEEIKAYHKKTGLIRKPLFGIYSSGDTCKRSCVFLQPESWDVFRTYICEGAAFDGKLPVMSHETANAICRDTRRLLMLYAPAEDIHKEPDGSLYLTLPVPADFLAAYDEEDYFRLCDRYCTIRYTCGDAEGMKDYPKCFLECRVKAAIDGIMETIAEATIS